MGPRPWKTYYSELSGAGKVILNRGRHAYRITTNIDDAGGENRQSLLCSCPVTAPCSIEKAWPGPNAIVGDENQLRGQIKRFQDMGVTDFNAAIMDTEDGAYADPRVFGNMNG